MLHVWLHLSLCNTSYCQVFVYDRMYGYPYSSVTQAVFLFCFLFFFILLVELQVLPPYIPPIHKFLSSMSEGLHV